jgi:hypothetical protein
MKSNTEKLNQLNLLLLMFDDLAKNNNHQQRGYLLQDLLNRVL